MERTVVCRTAQDMENLGREIGRTCIGGSVISLRGSLGAGKTVFAKGVARSLGIEVYHDYNLLPNLKSDYFAFSTMPTSLHLLSFERGLVSTTFTVSPICASLFSS